jgi:hypothetical protein
MVFQVLYRFCTLRCYLCTPSWAALSPNAISIDLSFYLCFQNSYFMLYSRMPVPVIVSSMANFPFVASLIFKLSLEGSPYSVYSPTRNIHES